MSAAAQPVQVIKVNDPATGAVKRIPLTQATPAQLQAAGIVGKASIGGTMTAAGKQPTAVTGTGATPQVQPLQQVTTTTPDKKKYLLIGGAIVIVIIVVTLLMLPNEN